MIDTPCHVCPASSSHAEAIVATIRDAFDANLSELFIYQCAGIARFVAEQIAVQEQGGDTHFSVALSGEELAGCAVLRRFPEQLFLDYLAIRPSFRGKGVGRCLLRDAIVLAGAGGRRKMALDVLQESVVPFRWYERLGFHLGATTVWWTLPTIPGDEVPVVLDGYPQAQVCQREFGFSRFDMWAGGRCYGIGRLGDRWYRLTQPDALTAIGVTAALFRLDPARRILLIAPDDVSPLQPQSQAVVRSCRMTADLEVVRQRLAARQT